MPKPPQTMVTDAMKKPAAGAADVRGQAGPSGMPQVANDGQMVTHAQNQGGPGGAGGGGGNGDHSTGGGVSGSFPPQPGGPAASPGVDLTSHYGGGIGYSGGPTPSGMRNMYDSFADPNRLQGAIPFWQSQGIQVGSQHGYDPGQTFAGQQVTGQSIRDNPMVAAAQQNFDLNVLPGIQNQFNTMGLGRSSAAGNAMARAQAGMLLPLYQDAANLENQSIDRQTQAGQFSAGIGQQDLNRLQGATESELGRRERSANAQTAGQQQLFENMMAMNGQQFSQGAQGSQQLFDMGGQARDYGQQANQSAQQDFLRRMGLSEEAINPFGGISGLLGSVTNGK